MTFKGISLLMILGTAVSACGSSSGSGGGDPLPNFVDAYAVYSGAGAQTTDGTLPDSGFATYDGAIKVSESLSETSEIANSTLTMNFGAGTVSMTHGDFVSYAHTDSYSVGRTAEEFTEIGPVDGDLSLTETRFFGDGRFDFWQGVIAGAVDDYDVNETSMIGYFNGDAYEGTWATNFCSGGVCVEISGDKR